MRLGDLWRKLTQRGVEEPDVRRARDVRSDLPSGLAKGMKPTSAPGQEKPKT